MEVPSDRPSPICGRLLYATKDGRIRAFRFDRGDEPEQFDAMQE